MDNIVVSICIATCNQERYINECLESVIGQSEEIRCEILIGDDMSEDGTSAIAARWAERHRGTVKHFRHTPRLGPAANYQFLVSRARGEFVAHLDGDDMWLPGKLAAQLDFLRARPGCPAVYTNAIVVDRDGALRGIFNNRRQPEHFDMAAMLKRGNFLNHSSLFYRRQASAAVMDPTPPFIDYLMHLRLAQFGPLGYVNRPYVVYRVGTSTSMIVRDNAHTRELYWEALSSVTPDDAIHYALAAGKGDFLRRIFFRSLRLREPSLFARWARRILERRSRDRLVIITTMILSIVTTSLAGFSEFLGLWLIRGSARVFYRR